MNVNKRDVVNELHKQEPLLNIIITIFLQLSLYLYINNKRQKKNVGTHRKFLIQIIISVRSVDCI